ncbi:MAG: fimbrillin family protein [Prevotellaceae bacterium]|nr:fimbrillin family protein [Prevotellaceae bacterium]MDY6131476.1 fimbrillin family protein [Prevotella sp.]
MKHTRLKNIRLSALLLIAGAVLFAACESEEKESPEKQSSIYNTTIGEAMTHITIAEESFENEEEDTRVASQTGKKVFVELGGGLQAEMTLEPDRETAIVPQTRAVISDGRYYIYAVREDGTRVTGVHSLLKGTVTAGTFTPDAGSALSLPNGKYYFVCYNDKVTDDGSNLTIDRANGERAMIGVTTLTQVSGHTMDISFTMRHQLARVCVKVRSYVSGGGVSGNIVTTSNQAASCKYNPNPNTGNIPTMQALTTPQSFPSLNTLSGATYACKATTYAYFFPGVSGNQLKINFTGGSLYGMELSGKSLPLSKLGTMLRNHSYVVNVKINKFGKYLFQDGTTGELEHKGTRTPIGLLLHPFNYSVHTAIALNEIAPSGGIQWSTGTGTHNTSQNGVHDMNGYQWTWGYDQKGSNSNFPAFQAAANYNPGVALTGSNLSQWYLPSQGQFYHGILTRSPLYAETHFSEIQLLLNESALNAYNALITAAGGTALCSNRIYDRCYYLTSTEASDGNAGTISFSYQNWADNFVVLFGSNLKTQPNANPPYYNHPLRIRPFINF